MLGVDGLVGNLSAWCTTEVAFVIIDKITEKLTELSYVWT